MKSKCPEYQTVWGSVPQSSAHLFSYSILICSLWLITCLQHYFLIFLQNCQLSYLIIFQVQWFLLAATSFGNLVHPLHWHSWISRLHHILLPGEYTQYFILLILVYLILNFNKSDNKYLYKLFISTYKFVNILDVVSLVSVKYWSR